MQRRTVTNSTTLHASMTGTPGCRPIISKNCDGGWPAGIHQGSSGATPGASGSRLSRSTEPGSRRSRFATLVLQLVQLLFQVRFALFQILQLAIPVINVGDVVLHTSCHVKAAAAILLDVLLQAGNRLVHGGDLAQNVLRAPAPVLFAVLSAIST